MKLQRIGRKGPIFHLQLAQPVRSGTEPADIGDAGIDLAADQGIPCSAWMREQVPEDRQVGRRVATAFDDGGEQVVEMLRVAGKEGVVADKQKILRHFLVVVIRSGPSVSLRRDRELLSPHPDELHRHAAEILRRVRGRMVGRVREADPRLEGPVGEGPPSENPDFEFFPKVILDDKLRAHARIRLGVRVAEVPRLVFVLIVELLGEQRDGGPNGLRLVFWRRAWLEEEPAQREREKRERDDYQSPLPDFAEPFFDRPPPTLPAALRRPITRIGENHVGGLLADHVNRSNDEKPRNPREYGGIDNAQILGSVNPEITIEHRHRIVLSADLACARGVMAPGVVLYELREVFPWAWRFLFSDAV